MKKLQVMFLAVVLVSSATLGKPSSIAVGMKDTYDRLSATGTVQIASNTVQDVFGSQEILDMCIANGWNGKAIAKGLIGKKITVSMAHTVYFLPKNGQWDFIKTIASGHSKAKAVDFMVGHSDVCPEDMSYVFDIVDGTETKLSAEHSLHNYLTLKSIRAKKLTAAKDASIQDLVDFLLLGGAVKDVKSVEAAKTQIKKLAVPLLKRSLRRKGETFVAQDGVNPIELEMKPVVDALNAPKLNGLEAALRGIGVDIPDIERTPAIWDAIIAEKDAVFMGDKPAHPRYDGGIILLLGPEGYNAWVKEFNEGK